MLNKAILMGRLTRDPELRHTQNNTPVASFRLAVDRGRKSADPSQPSANFIDIVAWNQQAEFISGRVSLSPSAGAFRQEPGPITTATTATPWKSSQMKFILPNRNGTAMILHRWAARQVMHLHRQTVHRLLPHSRNSHTRAALTRSPTMTVTFRSNPALIFLPDKSCRQMTLL